MKGRDALIITSIGYFVLFVSGPSAVMLMMTGYEKDYRNILIYTSILNLALSVVFVSFFGLLGAAISTSVSLIVKNIASLRLAKIKFGVWSF